MVRRLIRICKHEAMRMTNVPNAKIPTGVVVSSEGNSSRLQGAWDIFYDDNDRRHGGGGWDEAKRVSIPNLPTRISIHRYVWTTFLLFWLCAVPITKYIVRMYRFYYFHEIIRNSRLSIGAITAAITCRRWIRISSNLMLLLSLDKGVKKIAKRLAILMEFVLSLVIFLL